MQNLQPFIDSLQSFAQKRLGFQHPPKLFLKQDQENAKNMFGKTAYYDPSEKSITVFTTGRHPKDILRSIAHELVHHSQNLRGDLTPEKCGEMGTGYAQKNNHMREMEREAYEKGNLCFRDWEDGIKIAMQQENNQLKENNKMVKISKKELKGLIGKILERRTVNEKVRYKGEILDDLSDQGSFKDAFRTAREMSIPVFAYKGKAYTSKLAGDKKPSLKIKDTGKTPTDTIAKMKGILDPMGLGDIEMPKDTLAKMAAKMPKKGELTSPKAQDAAFAAKQAAKNVMKTAKTPVREEDSAFADSHYCIHHGGVEHNGQIAMAEAIQHVAPDENGFISHYDMKLEDGTILENVAAEEIQVTNASLAEAHHNKRDDHPAYKKKDDIDEAHCGKRDDEDLEEAHCGKRDDEDLEEAAKPDFPDVDGDGDTEEPISQAQKDKKETEKSSGKDKDLSKVPPQLRKHVAKKMAESKIQTPEQEKALYESRYNARNEAVFDKLKKLWTK
jgi:hypothetical protein